MLIEEDLTEILNECKKFNSLSDSQIAILGGTGFIGSWIVKALQELNRNYKFGSKITIYTRSIGKAKVHFGQYIDKNINLIEVDFAQGPMKLNRFDFLISGATPTNNQTGLSRDLIVYSSSIFASQSVVSSAKFYGNIPNIVNLSSGIVYGNQPMGMKHRLETSALIQSNDLPGYKNAKIDSEKIFEEAKNLGLLNVSSPRLFAFSGPGLPLMEHFAIGNFLSDALTGKKIQILGNESTLRSYMYPTDLTTWILSALVNTPSGKINIGSEKAISLFDLATLISDMTFKNGVVINNFTEAPSNYVPSTNSSRLELGVEERISLADGITRWIKWLGLTKN